MGLEKLVHAHSSQSWGRRDVEGIVGFVDVSFVAFHAFCHKYELQTHGVYCLEHGVVRQEEDPVIPSWNQDGAQELDSFEGIEWEVLVSCLIRADHTHEVVACLLFPRGCASRCSK